MNKFSELLLQAFEVAMDEKISTLQYDKTILATIESIENADTGEYKVKYKEGVISAFAYDPLESFKEGDSVYVTVPEGDFNNKKFISHKLSNNTLSTGQYKDLSETIIEVSPDASSLGFTYGRLNVPLTSPTYWGLVAGHNNTSIDSITIMGTSTFSNSFQTYLDNYEYLRIKAEFMTSLDKSHVKGSYGVSLIFLDTENKLVPYFLTFSDFMGDPYHLGSWTPQSVVVKLPRGTLAKVLQISFWEKDFDDNVGEANQINLFMRNLSISFVEKVDMTLNPYFLSIVAQEGTVFPSAGGVIHLAGRIINYGNEINPLNCIYQWFLRDLSVVSGSEDYDKRVGYGWKAIGGATDKDLAVSGSSVIGELLFKLLAVFNSTIVLTLRVILTHASLQVSIEQEAVNDTLKLKLVKLNASDAKTYVGDWYYLDTSGNYVKINGTTKVNLTPDISSYLYYSPMTFYCSVYVGNAYQGELTHVMRNMESIDDVSVVFTGESYFSYDANGDINIYDAELERTLTPQIVFNNGIISSSTTIEWLDFDGNVISGSYEWPNLSMITSVWVDTTTNILHYKIKHKFVDYPSKNNSFKIRITTIDGLVYAFDKEIICTKVGDPGTNGTKYLSLILVTSSNKFVGNTTSTLTKEVTLTCRVFKDQNELSSSNWSASWTPVNLTEVTSNSSLITVKATTSSAASSGKKRYVKATITIQDNGNTSILYDFFPVDTCNADLSEIDLSALLKYVQYASNGKNPQYRREIPEIKYENNIAEITSLDTNVITILGKIFKVSDNFVYPTKNDPTRMIGLLQIKVGNNIIYHPVPTYINTFGNENINSWDGTTVGVDKSGNAIFAPLIGAGTKDPSTNRFTGVIMGLVSGETKKGLYGYKDGESSFGLTDDGNAYFGTATGGGRIVILGDSATITGGGGGATDNGMTLTLANTTTKDTTLAILVANDKFKITYGGIMTAQGATIDGHLYALDGKIGSTSNTSSDGWTITTNRITSGSSSNHVALDSGSATIKDLAKYYTNAALTANLKTISGNTQIFNYTTYSGQTYVSFKLSGDSTTYYTLAENTSTDYAIWAGTTFPNQFNEKFSVKRDGTVFMREAIVKGTITAKAGAIGVNNSGTGGWTIGENILSSTLGTDYRLKPGIKYFTNLALTAGEATSTKEQRVYDYTKINDTVASFEFETNGTTYYSNLSSFYTPYVALKSSSADAILIGGTTEANARFYVTHSGVLKAENATITGKITAASGAIGGWVILENKIYHGNLCLYSGGKEDANYLDGNGNPYRFWAGSNNSSPGTSKFYITNAGDVRMVDAFSYGTIYAKEGIIGCTYTMDNETGTMTPVGGWSITKNKIYANIANKQKITVGAVYYTNSGLSNNAKTVDLDTFVEVTTDTATNYKKFKFLDEGNDKTYYTAPANIVDANTPGAALSSSGKYAIWTGHQTASEAPFSVTHAGGLKATSANISGKITADSGKIGGQNGWIIEPYLLYSGNVCLYSGTDYTRETDYYRIWAGSGKSSPSKAEFSVTDQGYLTAKNGSIGGWTITNHAISTLTSETAAADKSTGMALSSFNGYAQKNDGDTYDTSGVTKINNIRFWSGMKYVLENNKYYLQGSYNGSFFAVNSSGKLYCREAIISGDITTGNLSATGGTIGGWKITSRTKDNTTVSTLKAGTTYLDSDGYISCSSGSFTGSVTTGNLNATGGTIGGWTINTTTLSGGGVTLNSSDGSITGASIYSGKIWNSNKTSYIQCSTYTGGGSMKVVIYPGTDNENSLELGCGINDGILTLALSLGSASIYGQTHNPLEAKDWLLKSSSGFEFNGPVVLDSNSYGSPSPSSKAWQLGPFYGLVYFKTS